MPRGIPNVTRETESTDFVPHAGREPLDWTMLRTGVPQVQIVGEREFETTAETEAFMEELVVIQVHKSTDKNAVPQVPVGINGDKIWIPRGVPVRLPRKFVEVLARSQEATFSTDDNPDPNADEGKMIRRTNGQVYPFSVIQDRNPRGRAWLERVTREA